MKTKRTTDLKRTATITRGGVLVIKADGKAESNYHLDRLRSDYGEAFELRGFKAEGGLRYCVCIDPSNPRLSHCECLGFLKHRHCKHVESLTALLLAGRVPELIKV